MPRLIIALLFSSLIACGGDDPTAVDGGVIASDGGGLEADAGSEPSPACEANPELLASLAEALVPCRDLTNCPCGSRCELGACTTSCLGDDDCGGGEVCSRFGECVSDGQQGTLPPPSTEDGSPAFELAQSDVVTTALGTEHAIRIQNGASFLPSLRLIASVGSEVACDGETFVRDCSVSDVARNHSVTVAYRSSAEQDRPRSFWQLRAIAPGRTLSATLRLVEPEPRPSPEFQGLYRARVRFGDEELPVLLRVIGISASRAVLVLIDPAGGLLAGTSGDMMRATATIDGDRITGEFDSVALQTASEGVALNLGGQFELNRHGALLSGQMVLELRHGRQLTERFGRIDARWSRALERTETRPPSIDSPTIQPLDDDAAFPWALAVGEQIDAGAARWRSDQAPGWRQSGTLAFCGSESPEPHRYATQAQCNSAADRLGCHCPPFLLCGGRFTPPCGDNPWVCSYPRDEAELCLQRVLCFEPQEPASLNAAAFTNRVGGASGDAVCGGVRSQHIFPALVDLDGLQPERDLGAVLGQCFQELASDEPPVAAGSPAAALGRLMPLAQCFSPGRFYTTLEGSMAPLLSAAEDGETSSERAQATLFQYLISGWLRTHTLLLEEVSRAHGLAGLEEIRNGSIPRYEQAVEQLDRAWDLILHPRVRKAVSGIATADLVSPDYRGPNGVSRGGAGDVQTDPMALVMLRALHDHLGFHERWIQRRRFSSEEEPETEQSASFVTRSAYLADLAMGWAARDELSASQRRTVDEAYEDLIEARRRVWFHIRALKAGLNPLDITDGDLPMQYDATAVDGAGRYFSSARALIVGLGSSVDSLRTAENEAISARDREMERAYRSYEFDQVGDEVRGRFSDELSALCGSNVADSALDPASSADPAEVISTCYMADNRRECQVDQQAILDQVSDDDLAYQICYINELRELYGHELEFDDSELDEMMNEAARGSIENVVRDMVETGRKEGFWEGAKRILPTINADLGHRSSARARCAAQFPNAVQELPPVPTPDPRAGCYQGSLGEQVISLLLAAEQIETARAMVAELSERYDLAMRDCAIQEATEAEAEEARARHDMVMQSLNVVKTAADVAASSGKVTLNPMTWVEAGATGLSAATSGAMTALEREHQSAMANLRAESALKRCYVGAQAHLVGMRSATNRIEEQYLHYERASVALTNAQFAGVRIINRARAELARVAGRPDGHLAKRSLSREVEAFEAGVMLARRYAFLAVRGIESASQRSLPNFRRAALGIRRHDDARDLLENLQAELTNRTLVSGRVSDQTAVSVISLRDHLLQVTDHSDGNPQYQNLNASEAFGVFVSSEANARYDDDGTFLGYTVPFTLLPPNALNLETAQAVLHDQLFASSTCAERLWSLTASLTGAPSMFEGSDSRVMVILRKGNSFMSRRCDGRGEGTFVTESYRPWRNLYAGEDQQVNAGSTSPYTSNATQVLMNASNEELASSAGEQDRTFAGMGVFGDYELFFEASTLAAGPSAPGLHLERIEDVTLRIEFLKATPQ